jgi:hypothetical protein
MGRATSKASKPKPSRKRAGGKASSDGGVERVLRAALKSQYLAALTALQRAVERCPADLWTKGTPAYWHVAYHTAFYTHLYLQPNEATFRPRPEHRDEHQFLTSIPWPPYRPPKLGEPYTRAQVLEYVRACVAMVAPAVDALDLCCGESGFDWYPMPKLEHQLVNLRHIQHHAAVLSARLRAATGKGVAWVGAGEADSGVKATTASKPR